MRPFPDYPDYKTARPPRTARWLLSMGVVGGFSGGVMLLPLAEGKSALIAAGMLIALILTSSGWLVQWLYYRVSVHNATFYYQQVAYEQQQWWIKHRQSFWLKEVVLLGPAGKSSIDWLRVLGKEQSPPEERREDGGYALRLPQISATDVSVREKRLAELLVIEWQNQCTEKTPVSLRRCYWQGTDSAWQAFRAQIHHTFPDMALPLRPEPWRGEVSLAEIADGFPAFKPQDTILIAGCQAVAVQRDTNLPAGESAVLCLVGQNGSVQLTRGETFSAENGESLLAVCTRALEQSELEVPPEACLLFSRSEFKTLENSGWDIHQYQMDVHWGNVGEMDALIVLALAAIYARYYQQPCGWIACDPGSTFAIGIVKPDGQRQ